jgi:phosphoenolpyruvate synthase/pyruvate phosphate dikinase
MPKQSKYVYFFGGGKADGNGKMKDLLGGKGAGLAEMSTAGVPVPPGFTITTDVCRPPMSAAIITPTVKSSPKNSMPSTKTASPNSKRP